MDGEIKGGNSEGNNNSNRHMLMKAEFEMCHQLQHHTLSEKRMTLGRQEGFFGRQKGFYIERYIIFPSIL
jgi:hypothetical protein